MPGESNKESTDIEALFGTIKSEFDNAESFVEYVHIPFVQDHPLKLSSLKFDKIFNYNLFLPETYNFVKKSKGIFLMYVFYTLGFNCPCNTILEKEVFDKILVKKILI